MSATTSALSRIEGYLGEFQRGVQRCVDSDDYDAADWKDAYNRLYSFFERYDKERSLLNHAQQQALDKAADDTFIKGLLDLRVVGAHVTKREGAVYRTHIRQPVALHVEASANGVFSARVANVLDVDGKTVVIDHDPDLKLALEILTKAVNRAKAASEPPK